MSGEAPPRPPGLRGRVADALDRRQRVPRAVLLVGLAGLFATTFPITVLTLALPTIAEDFATDEAGLAWLITLPMLASALALPVLGKLGDLYGHRRVFIIGFAVATVATALSATATGPGLLIAWRTLGQVAGSSTMPSSLALINSVHHGARRAKAMGWWSMIAAIGPVIGLTAGAPAIDAVGWPMLFLLQALVMTVPVTAAWLVLRETPRRPARFDLAGAAALALGVGPLLLAVDQVPDWGLASPRTLGCLAVAGLALAVFPRLEQRAAAPLVPLELLRSRATVATLTVVLLSGAAYMGGFFLASLLLVTQFGFSLTSAVPVLSIRPILFAASSPVGGRVTARSGARFTAAAGCLSLAAGLAGLALGSAVDSLVVVVVCGFLLQGIGFGLLRPALTTALADAVSEHDLGMAGASERLANQVGVVFGITAMASVYAAEVDRFPPAFAVGSVAAVAAAAVAGAMRRPRARPPDLDAEPDRPAGLRSPATPPEPGVDRPGPEEPSVRG